MTGEPRCSRASDRVAFESAPATAPPARACSTPRTATVRTPAFVPLASTATVKSLHAAEVAALGYDMVLGNTFHLFIQPGARAVAEMGGLHEFMGWRRPIITDSGGFQVFSMGHGSVAEEIKRRRDRARVDGDLDRGGGRALPLLRSTGASASWAPRPRWRCRRRSAPTSRSPSTSARPFHVERDYTARSMERTHRWLDRCVAGAREHAPPGSSSTASSRAASTRTCAPSRPRYVARRRRGRHRDRRLARPGEGPDARGGRLVARAGCPTSRRATCSGSATWTTSSTPSAPASTRFDCATPTRLARHGTALVPRPRPPLAARPAKGVHRPSREPIDRGLPLPGLPRAHARLPPLPDPRR